MSGPKRSTGTVRQLSLQQPAPRRQHIRRQRSADDEKSLHVYQSQAIRGRLATTKSSLDKPKGRIAWGESKDKNERAIKVEVVARQIAGRSKPTAGRSVRTSAEKASILYSRQDLAERLRLAWKHRQENGANIDIFLAHGTVEKRSDSELSNHYTATSSTSPLPLKELNTSPTGSTNADLNENYQAKTNDLSATNKNANRVQEDTKSVISTSDNFVGERKQQNDDEDSIAFHVTGLKNVETTYFFHEYSVQNKIENDVKDEQSIIGTLNQQYKAEQGIPELKANNNANQINNLISKEEKTFRTFGKKIEMPTESANSDGDSQKPNKKSAVNTDHANSITNSSIATSSTTLPSIRSEIIAPGNIKVKKNESHSAKQKRASFQSGANRAFLTPVIDKVIPANEKMINTIEKFAQAKGTNYDKLELKAKRTNSAPPQKRPTTSVARTQVNIVIDTPGISGVTENSLIGKLESDNRDSAVIKYEDPSIKTLRNRAIRSAPLKRRSKSAKRRPLVACKDEEDSNGRPRSRLGGRGKCNLDGKAADVVTMVSLVSSAESDSEIDNSPGDEKLINELRSKLPTTPIIKTINQPTSNTIRKPIKSVSFQGDSIDGDIAPKESTTMIMDDKKIAQPRLTDVNSPTNAPSTNEEMPAGWRTDIACVNLPVLSLVENEVESANLPLTDREKRCLAVPIGDIHDKKRKFLRTRSTPTRSTGIDRSVIASEGKGQSCQFKVLRNEQETNQTVVSADDSSSKVNSVETAVPKKEESEMITIASEPNIQTTKEKECWHLYRRMCDKGVYVSFDTVLRGMLTPTEYRIRQKKLLNNV